MSADKIRVYAYCDESGNENDDQPLVVGVLTCDEEHDALIEMVKEEYQATLASPGFSGSDRYDRFRKNGFHSSADGPDEQERLFNCLKSAPGLKAFMVTTDRTTLKAVGSSQEQMPEVEQIAQLYRWVCDKVIRKYRNVSSIEFIVEENRSFKKVFHDFECHLASIAEGIENGPAVSCRMEGKAPDSLLSFADHILAVTARWLRGDDNHLSMKKDQDWRAYRHFLNIQHCISILYSFETGVISSRRQRIEDY